MRFDWLMRIHGQWSTEWAMFKIATAMWANPFDPQHCREYQQTLDGGFSPALPGDPDPGISTAYDALEIMCDAYPSPAASADGRHDMPPIKSVTIKK